MAGHSSRIRALRLMIAYAAVAGYLAPRCCCSGAHPKKDWNAAKDSTETASLAEFNLPEATETAVHILDDDASMHKNAAAESDQQDANQLTVLDELFGGTWGAFILKDNLGHSAELPPNVDSAELSSAGSDELAAEDSNVEVRDFDHPALGEARLLPDDLSSEDVTEEIDDWPTGDAAAADLAAAKASVEDSLPPREHSVSSIKIGHSGGKDSIRSHWRRGQDQAANRRRTADIEPVAAETVADRQMPTEGSRLSPPRGRHIVAFRFSGPPDAEVAGVTPGRGHGANVKGGSDAGRSAAVAATDETAQRLPSDGLGHWGRFLPSEAASQQQLRRTPADGDSNHNTLVAAVEPGHADRIRRPPLTPEQHQPSIVGGGGRHDELRSAGFLLAVRPPPSVATAPHHSRSALAIAAPVQQREGKPDLSALTDSEAGRTHPITPAAVAAHSVDRDGRRRFASGSDRPSYTAATKAIDDGDGHSDGGRVPNPGGGHRVAAAAAADAHGASWPALSAPLVRRQRLPHVNHQRELGVAVGERGFGGESSRSSSSWGFVGDHQQQQQQVGAAERNTTTVDREVHSRVSVMSRGERRPRPRPTVEGRFVV